MKKLFTFLSCVTISAFSYGEIHDGNKVTTVSGFSTEGCTFFKLEGVSQADPAKENNPWFAIPNDTPGHDTIVSILLTSFTAEKPVRVSTTGTMACDYATVRYVRFSE